MAESLSIKYAKAHEKRKRLSERLSTTFRMISGLPKNVNVFKVRAGALPELFKEYNEILEILEQIQAEDDTLTSDTSKLASLFEETYFSVMAVYEEIKAREEAASPVPRQSLNDSSGSHNPELRGRLPPLQIPKYSGKVEEFPTFLALFNALVHETTLAEIEKFSYLRGYLEGPAAELINTVEFTATNYLIAYQLLVDRFTNKRVIANSYLTKLLNLPPIRRGAADSRRSLDIVTSTITSIKALGIPDMGDFILLHLGLRLLDPKVRHLFEQTHLDVPFPTFEQFKGFLNNQGALMDIVSSTSVSSVPNPSTTKGRGFHPRVMLIHHPEGGDQRKRPPTPPSPSTSIGNHPKCPACSEFHRLSRCGKFLALGVGERKTLVKTKGLCFSCLGQHKASSCRSRFNCKTCGLKSHNSLLHLDNDGQSTSPLPPPIQLSATQESQKAVSLVSNCPPSTSSAYALLGTAQAYIYDVNGHPLPCRIILDFGSQANLITESLAHRLGLPRRKSPCQIQGVGQLAVPTKNLGMISAKITPIHERSTSLSLDLVVIPRITSDLPSTPLSAELRNKFAHIGLADCEFHRPAPVNILLGVQAVLEVMRDFPPPLKGTPTAIPTIFGFVLMGSLPNEPAAGPLTSLCAIVSADTTNSSLEHTIKRFWEQEEVASPIPLSPDETACVEHFQETISRDGTGRFIARLPFVNRNPPVLGSTRERALKRLFRLEAKFKHNPLVRELYTSCLQDYVSKGHAIPAVTPSKYLITHHGVVKGTGNETRLRVVFNPSEKDPSGVSLNDSLLVGPKLQADIGNILTRFRLHQVAVVCDIKAMFRAIRLHPQDQDFLHFLWRFSSTDPITEWQLTTVTFGVASSPFTAQATLARLVQEEGHKYPAASNALQNASYVDDVITGTTTVEEAQDLCSQLIALLSEGGFELGKWASSVPSLFSHQGMIDLPVQGVSEGAQKVLGIGWDPTADVFQCKIDTTTYHATKRGVLSKVARLYDPNGYYAPTTFALKVIVQQLWLLKIDWDDPLPPHILSLWTEMENELPLLENIQIPRWILADHFTAVQLIGFSDASERGMCAALYLRVETPENTLVHLLGAKTKLCPLKSWTIPRLELGAAHLLARLITSTKGIGQVVPISQIICFTDSMTTLAWLRTPPYRLKQFVSNRVSQIQDLHPSVSWRHVPGHLNPADPGSRGLRPSKLIDDPLWWHGPPFLAKPIEHWPPSPPPSADPPPELKEPPIFAFIETSSPSTLLELTDRSSSFLRLQRVVAYVLRFVSFLKGRPSNSRNIPITAKEYNESLNILVKVTQHHYFRHEMALLNSGKPCTTQIAALAPFVSTEGILRVGGRLQWAPISDARKHPILIPKTSHLAELIVDYYHAYTLHGGPKLVQALIHHKFWIPAARSLIRRRIMKCIPCTRFTAPVNQPQMAALPLSRLSPGKAFSHTGLDFAGPFLIKTSNRRNAATEKGYFALFSCLTTRATHLEMVSSLTTSACLAAIDRFLARRGLPTSLYSDNGRNLRGAAREMSEVHAFLLANGAEFKEYLAQRQIAWVFNPPVAPNFGGAWESMIKQTKRHLKRILGDKVLNFEEYATLLTRIEAILNSRPLTALPGSPNEPVECLTPGHFLIGGPLLARPELDVTHENPDHLTRWKMLRHLTQVFWNKWKQEYLQTLQPRSRWTRVTPNLQEGAVVLLKAPNSPPTQWPMGRVVGVESGSGGAVRVVRVKTVTGILTRPTNSLVVLPTS